VTAQLPAVDPPGPNQFGSFLLKAAIQLPGPCPLRAHLELFDHSSGATSLVEPGARAPNGPGPQP
jgi:hypothetical protein